MPHKFKPHGLLGNIPVGPVDKLIGEDRIAMGKRFSAEGKKTHNWIRYRQGKAMVQASKARLRGGKPPRRDPEYSAP